MITSKEVRERLHYQPFEPFRIVTSSGQHYDVLHPEFLLVTKRTLVVATPKTEGDKDPDGYHAVSILHITALEQIPTKVKKK
jgi:hypothetical protein